MAGLMSSNQHLRRAFTETETRNVVRERRPQGGIRASYMTLTSPAADFRACHDRKIAVASVNRFTRESAPRMSFFGLILMEDRMSMAVRLSADAPVNANARREQPYLWTAVLILGVIVALAIGASFYVDAPLLDASMVGP